MTVRAKTFFVFFFQLLRHETLYSPCLAIAPKKIIWTYIKRLREGKGVEAARYPFSLCPSCWFWTPPTSSRRFRRGTVRHLDWCFSWSGAIGVKSSRPPLCCPLAAHPRLSFASSSFNYIPCWWRDNALDEKVSSSRFAAKRICFFCGAVGRAVGKGGICITLVHCY